MTSDDIGSNRYLLTNSATIDVKLLLTLVAVWILVWMYTSINSDYSMAIYYMYYEETYFNDCEAPWWQYGT